MKRDGFSLLELLVVMMVFGIVAAWGTANYTGWRNKYDMEKQVRETFADLTNLRVMARTKNMSHFATFAAGQITAKEDSNGNLTRETTDRTLCLWNRATGQGADAACGNNQSVSVKTLKYPITWSGNATLAFDSRGLADQNETVCIDYGATSDVNATYDCIDVSATRIALGSLINKSGACSNANCQIKR